MATFEQIVTSERRLRDAAAITGYVVLRSENGYHVAEARQYQPGELVDIGGHAHADNLPTLIDELLDEATG